MTWIGENKGSLPKMGVKGGERMRSTHLEFSKFQTRLGNVIHLDLSETEARGLGKRRLSPVAKQRESEGKRCRTSLKPGALILNGGSHFYSELRIGTVSRFQPGKGGKKDRRYSELSRMTLLTL